MTHFISAPCHQSSRTPGFQFAPEFVKNMYDHKLDSELFNNKNNCLGYKTLYDYISKYTKDKEKSSNKIVTIGGDHSISLATIPAMNEKYNGNLKVLYIDSCADINIINPSKIENLDNSVVSSILGFNFSDKFVMNPSAILKPDQLLYLGTLDVLDDSVSQYGINCITCKKIEQLGIDTIIDTINTIFDKKYPIHISLDLKVLKKSYAPCTVRTDKDDGNMELLDLIKLLDSIKDRVVSFDIVEFNPSINNEKGGIFVTKKVVQQCLTTLFDIKEKSINVFNENSEFIIYRPSNQENITDIGWYIMRGTSLKEREEFLKSIADNTIIKVSMDDSDEDYLVTKTTMNEQNQRSYYVCTKIEDITLFPEEKIAMCFELINSINGKDEKEIIEKEEDIIESDKESDNSNDELLLDNLDDLGLEWLT